MAVRYTWDDQVTNKRAIGDIINNLDFTSAPLLKLFGTGRENIKKFEIVNWGSTKVEWLHDTMPILKTKLAASLNNTDLTFTVTTDEGKFFNEGDVLAFLPDGQDYGEPTEKVVVQSVSGDVITVYARGFGSTSAAAHASGATILLATRMSGEATGYVLSGLTVPTAEYNVTQIIKEAVSISGSDEVYQRYGIDDEMTYHLTKLLDDGGRQGKLAQLLHRSFYHGERVARSTVSGETVGSMGGFKTYVTSLTASDEHVINKNGQPLQKGDIHQVLRAIRDAGTGEAVYLITSSWGIEKICAMFEDNRYTTTDTSIVGSPEVTTIRTPHGDIKLVWDWLCDRSEYYFVNPRYIGWLPYREFTRKKIYGGWEESPVDAAIEEVIGEYTFALANPKSHGRIYNAAVNA
jgi:hypothetical protein